MDDWAESSVQARHGGRGSTELAMLTKLTDRCLLPGMSGTELSPSMRDWLGTGLGGVILFGHNIVDHEQLTRLTTDLHAAGRDVLVAVDEEGGDVTRLHHRHGAPNPGNLALGHLDDVRLTRRIAGEIGRELASVGIDLDLAPVADVNSNRQNPIIGTRSFGADPDLVARHVVAYLEGLRDAGIPGCAKHFPGHGDTEIDSHLALPEITGDLEPHLRPFRAAIAAGVPAILSAHIVYGALDDRPATLSKAILTDLLRGELGFDGVVVTDSLTMSAITARMPLPEAALRALGAGADLLCMNGDEPAHRAVRDRIIAAAASGELPVDRLAEAAERVGRLASRRAASSRPLAEPWTPAQARALPQGDLPLRDLLLIDVEPLDRLPLPTNGSMPYVVEVAPPRRGIELSAGSLLAALTDREAGVDGVRLYEGDVELDVPADRPLVLVVRDAHKDREQQRVIERCLASHPDVLVVGIGTPYDRELAPGRYIGTHGGARPNLIAAADAIL